VFFLLGLIRVGLPGLYCIGLFPFGLYLGQVICPPSLCISLFLFIIFLFLAKKKKSEESKAYKLYDPVKEKIIVSRDVVFEESKGWIWNEKSNTEVIAIEGDDEIGGNNKENVEIAENSSSESSSNEGNDEENDDADDNDETPPARLRKKPSYLDDYVIGQESKEEAELHNLAVFSTSNDPITYEEAIKHE